MLPQQVTITVTTAGTPVQISATKTQCSMVWFINRIGDVITVGILGLNKSTGQGVIRDLPPISSGAEPETAILQLPFNPMAEYPYDLRDYWVDSVMNGDVVDVVYWQL
jgi:hypothetical protein